MLTLAQEQELLLSDASHLRPYLPWAFLTSQNLLVTTLDVSERVVPASELKKVYYWPVIESLIPLFEDKYGDARRDMFNELQIHKLGRMALAGQWERWERDGGTENVQARVQQSVERQLHPSPIASFQRKPVFVTPPLHHPVPGTYIEC